MSEDIDYKIAKYSHEQYERLAIKHGWKTQELTKVDFDKLPEANKKVMLELAELLRIYIINLIVHPLLKKE